MPSKQSSDSEVQDNASDPKRVQEKARNEKERRKAELSDLRFVLASVEGRRFLRRFLAEAGVFRSSFQPNAQIYYNEGIRSVGVKLWGEIEEADPELLLLMLKEGSDHSN